LCEGPVTFHLIRRPVASSVSRHADAVPGVTSVETDKSCPCLMELNAGCLMRLSVFVLISLVLHGRLVVGLLDLLW